MNKLPTVSFVVATFNSQKTLEACLSSVNQQDYPKQLLEIIIADGGSKDETIKIAHKYKAKIVNIADKNQNAEYNRAVGIHKAKNDLIAIIDHDNVLPHKLWLKKMVCPFLEYPAVIGAETLRYQYNQSDKMLGRYFSLLGANDILPFYLGKSDRLSYMFDKPQEYGCYKKAQVVENNEYYLVKFNKNAIPTLGSNGFLIRRQLLLSQSLSDPEHFFHIDVNVDLIHKGFSTYAVIKDTLIHNTNVRGIADYFQRRKLFMEKYHLLESSNRRYSVYEPKDLRALIVTIIKSLTVLVPLKDALRGFLKIQDIAWFLHPVMCFGTVIIYGYTLLKFKIIK